MVALMAAHGEEHGSIWTATLLKSLVDTLFDRNLVLVVVIVIVSRLDDSLRHGVEAHTPCL